MGFSCVDHDDGGVGSATLRTSGKGRIGLGAGNGGNTFDLRSEG